MTNMTKAELIAALQAALAAQAAPSDAVEAQEVIIMDDAPQGGVADTRAANYEPWAKGSAAAVNNGSRPGLKRLAHTGGLNRVRVVLNALAAVHGGQEFTRPNGGRTLVATITPGGHHQWGGKGSANQAFDSIIWALFQRPEGGTLEPISEWSNVVSIRDTKPQVWKINLHRLAELNEFLKLS
jgi:hypothetical protein